MLKAICRRNLQLGVDEPTIEIHEFEENDEHLYFDEIITLPLDILYNKDDLIQYILDKRTVDTQDMSLFIESNDEIMDIMVDDKNTEIAAPRELPYYQASTTCSGTGYATAPVYYTYYYYAGVNYYYYYCCPSGGSVSGSDCYYYYGATPVTYGQYECRAGGSLQSDGVTCLRNNC